MDARGGWSFSFNGCWVPSTFHTCKVEPQTRGPELGTKEVGGRGLTWLMHLSFQDLSES